MQTPQVSRRAIGRFNSRRTALNNEDEVNSKMHHAAGSCMLWFYGKGGGRPQNHNKAEPSCCLRQLASSLATAHKTTTKQGRSVACASLATAHKTTTKQGHSAACASLPALLPQPTKPQQSRAILLPARVCLLFCHRPQNHNRWDPVAWLASPSTSSSLLSAARRPSNRPISRRDASRICVYQSNDVESSSKKLLEFWDRLYPWAAISPARTSAPRWPAIVAQH